MSKKSVAIVLAAGKGKRMNREIEKQYLLLNNKPVLFYCLDVLERSFMDEIILVVGQGEVESCKKNIVDAYGFAKVKKIVEGGKERYHSVYQGLSAIEYADDVYIHDGARPLISLELLESLRLEMEKYSACVAAVPVKDTIKVANDAQFVIETPKRSTLWAVQTPQVFSFSKVKQAYDQLILEEMTGVNHESVTDDCMVMEQFCGISSKLVFSSYKNIKITTNEDMLVAESFLNSHSNELDI